VCGLRDSPHLVEEEYDVCLLGLLEHGVDVLPTLYEYHYGILPYVCVDYAILLTSSKKSTTSASSASLNMAWMFFSVSPTYLQRDTPTTPTPGTHSLAPLYV
jgi:hypothetical protein